MRRFSPNAAIRRLSNKKKALCVRYAHSTPPVMEQVEYQYQDGYLDLMEHTAQENAFGEYFKACLEKQGVEFQSLETAAYQLLMDEQEFDPPAPPRPDSPAWGYMYGNNLVDFKAMAENLPADKEYKRGFFTSYIDALEKKLKMHYPNLDWTSKLEARQAQWEAADQSMTAFQRNKAEAMADAVVSGGPAEYIELYRSNSHFKFGADDPYHYYMPKDNEEKWVRLQQFEWDLESKTADVAPYIEALGKVETLITPVLAEVPFKQTLKDMLASRQDGEAVAAMFANAMPATAGDVAAMTKIIDAESPARLAVALAWGNKPDLFAQLFVTPGAVDKCVADNGSAATALAAAYKDLAAKSAAFAKAMDGAAANLQKAVEAGGAKNSGVKAMLMASGFSSAASAAEVPQHGLAARLSAVGSGLRGQSLLAYVFCEAASRCVAEQSTVRTLYDRMAYGAGGADLCKVAHAAADRSFGDAVQAELTTLLQNSGNMPATLDLRAVVSDTLNVTDAAKAVVTARAAADAAWGGVSLDYGLVDLASLSIQYKY